jgi:hypothetical protein
MMPILSPEGQIPSFRTRRIETTPNEPDWFARTARALSGRSGYLSIKPNHPDTKFRSMVTANQNNGKTITKTRELGGLMI